MIRRISDYFNHQDQRGIIQGIINFGTWEEINYITSVEGAVRGGHYHKYTKEAFLVLKGKIKIVTRNLGCSQSDLDEDVVKKGDVFIIDPYVIHTFYTIEDAAWINILSQRINKENQDIYTE
jgi:dTDP-4-dehydrorhamnose 3,5-epimerase-like enzyme